jgi:ketosteroid isomerase-like protein
MNTQKLSRAVLSGVASTIMMLSVAGPAVADGGTVTQESTFEARATPAGLLAQLGEFMVARDLDGVMSIHEPEAALVEWGGAVARTEEEIRKVYEDFFATEPVLNVNAQQIVDAGGVAIILGDYTLDYKNANGTVVSVDGKFGDIVRQQPDGSWLYLLDNPYAP